MKKISGRLFLFILGMVISTGSITAADGSVNPADGSVNAAEGTRLSYSGNGGYSLVERTNLRRYVNGRYIGLTSREVRSFVSPSLAPSKRAALGFEDDQWYDGSFYVMEETLRNNQAASAGIHDSIQSMFHISQNGIMTMYKDNGYPSFRSFPAFTSQAVNPGDRWEAEAERAVDPLNKGIVTRMPIFVQYTFIGPEIYKEKNVYRIKALWQTNYNMSVWDPKGDSSLQKGVGGHKADILILQETGEPILVVDTVDETFVYSDGQQINFKGTITLFTEFPPAVDHEKLIPALQRVAVVVDDKQTNGSKTVSKGISAGETPGFAMNESKWIENGNNGGKRPVVSSTETGGKGETKYNIVAEKTTAGIRLSVRDIKFKPDSDEILSSEKERLDEIANVLKMAGENKFLVEGHTASVGRPAGEQTLSEQRARRIAVELSQRGISGDRFICRGWGGNKPIASNETDEGRAQNRRVEITILE